MSGKRIIVISGLIIAISIPITLSLIYQRSNTSSRAAEADKLETESGIFSSSGATKVSDSGASGGQYVSFTNQTPSPTPTSAPSSQTGVGPRSTPPTPSGNIVPSSIDKTGTTDVTSALQSWINSQPNGTAASPTILIFPSGAIYKMNGGLRIDNKSYITLWGYGSTLRPMGNGSTTGNSGFRLQNSSNLKILGFRIKGANDAAGTANAYGVNGEFSMGVALMDNSDDVEIADNWISNVFGDGVYISYSPTGYPDRYNIHHNLIELTGRQGIVPDSGIDGKIEWNIIRDSAMSAIDAEDARGGVILGPLYIRNNLIDRWAWYGGYTCHAIVMDYKNTYLISMSNIYIENNTLQGGCMAPSGTNAYPQAQDADISMWGDMPKSNIYIRNNTFNLPSNQKSGWAIRLNNVNGGQVTGNVIPGQTVQCPTCYNVTITNNQ
jgi:hypothetical protein